jgi:hypothetical protein
VQTGGPGHDWFVTNLDTGVRDKLSDLSPHEFALALDFMSAL